MDDKDYTSIQKRYQNVRRQVESAAQTTNHGTGRVRLVVVTKSKSLDVVKAVIDAGARMLGENYLEEAEDKIASLANPDIEWHMIGHLQSRKADRLTGKFKLLHSLDSVKLASRLSKACCSRKEILPVLLEMNVSGEASKFGFQAWDKGRWMELVKEIDLILEMPGLKIIGLMTMPPYFPDPEDARPYFQKTRRLQSFLCEHFPTTHWDELSMGTSADYIQAIEEGATFVRVGQAILGTREQ